MNFLLHHRLALRDLDAGASAVGAMLPDLWRMADKSVRPARALEATVPTRVAEILAGIEHHARADTVFHACRAFVVGERAMSRELGAIPAPKLTLFAHVAWELCLDGSLVRREASTLLLALRGGIERATENVSGETALEVAARLHHMARRGAPLPEDFNARIARLVAEIARGPWVEGYARGEAVAERLDAIRRRLGLEALSTTNLRSLSTILEGAISSADEALDEILALRL
jgi:hypothetical protein